MNREQKQIELDIERNVTDEGFIINSSLFMTYLKEAWQLRVRLLDLDTDDNDEIPLLKENMELIHNRFRELYSIGLFPSYGAFVDTPDGRLDVSISYDLINKIINIDLGRTSFYLS